MNRELGIILLHQLAYDRLLMLRDIDPDFVLGYETLLLGRFYIIPAQLARPFDVETTFEGSGTAETFIVIYLCKIGFQTLSGLVLLLDLLHNIRSGIRSGWSGRNRLTAIGHGVGDDTEETDEINNFYHRFHWM